MKIVLEMRINNLTRENTQIANGNCIRNDRGDHK